MFTKFKLIGLGLMIVTIAVLGWQVKYWHGAYVVAKQAHEVEKQAHAVTTASFESYRTNADEQMVELRDNLAKVEQNYNKSRKESEKLSKLLAKHDFTHLTERKPGLIERRINGATDRVMRKLEDISTRFSGEFTEEGGEGQ